MNGGKVNGGRGTEDGGRSAGERELLPLVSGARSGYPARMRKSSFFTASSSLLFFMAACGGSGDVSEPGGAQSHGAGAGGASAGAAGTAVKAGAAGKGGGGATAGQAGAAGKAGGAGQAGAAGKAGGSGNAGKSGAGGQSGASGQSGAAGKAGGAGLGGAGGAGQGGGAGMSGSSGSGGAPCADTCKSGVCVQEVCCPKSQACGDVCCPGGDVCSFQKCVSPGLTCIDAEDCAPGEYCELSLGGGGKAGAGGAAGKAGANSCAGGVEPPKGKCLPRPPTCGGGSGGAGGQPGVTCIEACEFKPPSIPMTPEVMYAWGSATAPSTRDDIMMAPIVVQLDDDDCDGKVTARDIPEIVVSTFTGGQYNSAGVVRALSVQGGALVEKWSAPGIKPGRGLAGGNFDGKPGNELVGCLADGKVVAYDGAGKTLWTIAAAHTCAYPAIADLDQDGHVEVIVEGAILNGADGTVKHTYSAAPQGTFAVSDLDGDGKLDIVTATQGFHGDGTLFVDTGVPSVGSNSGPAVADLDKDGKPEVIAAYFSQHAITVWQYDAAAPQKFKAIRPSIDLNGTLNPADCAPGSAGSKWGGGPVTVGDFNSDGFPDVALAGGVGYAVFDGKKLMDTSVAANATHIWTKKTQDCSSASTGSSLFDFDGDGKAEVVYADEITLRIYEGATGNVLFSACNTTGTLNEYPVVADVDNDGHADIVVVSNAYSSLACAGGAKTAGVRVFGDKLGRWVRTRRVWNQHSYHVNNIEEDGAVPKLEAHNWSVPGLNNFRQNKQPGGEFSAPDAIVTLASPDCGASYALTATVTNVGEAPLPAGVLVGFYRGSPPGGALLGKVATTGALYPAQSEVVSLPTNDPAVKAGTYYVVVDDGGAPHPSWTECRPANNTFGPVSGECKL